ncbi:DNA polymerase III subunit delta' [Stappia sp. F7233]|uniref:DNA polymerase III subunit delta n=1 Tax=Stappia albiluteola TaxID=2758565 RepID=A0A839AB04_9HYPH|nr:DNA polymerase III subunit delta' [Stappia albiluteola]MBA5776763.1 DNA polymerase III subunit delta' [Stappia albiluteola]
MAKREIVVSVGEADELDGVPLPRETSGLIGHGEAEGALLAAYRSERFHHAWIIGGLRGIGKATLAFRFARYVLSHPDRFSDAVAQAKDLSVEPQSPVSRKIAAGSHPDLLHLRRPYDDKRDRFKSDLPVDEVRRTVSFFGSTAAGGNWRVCIVDAADDMNLSAANALLKILEEPPPRSVFLVLSHAPGRLLPTIRSRCRQLLLRPLSGVEMGEGIAHALPGLDLSNDDLERISRLADGSLRRAIQLAAGGGLDFAREFEAMVALLPHIDVDRLHRFAEMAGANGAEDAWQLFHDLAADYLHRRLKEDASGSGGRLVRWSEVWEKTVTAVSQAEALNLDRKQVILSVFRQMAEAERMRSRN